MVVKLKESFEKTRHVKNNEKFRKVYSLRIKKCEISWKKYYQIKRNLIICHNFTNFLEDYNRYRAKNFNVYLTFNGLSNNISHIVVA